MRWLITVLLFIPMSLTQAIVIRDDVPDADYRVADAEFPYLCSVAGAMGTALDAHWVLTAAHVAKYAQPGAQISCGGEHVRQLQQVFLVPGTRLFLPDHWDHDIAMIRLDRGLPEMPFPTIHRNSDEAGRQVLFVGHGGTGNGVSGIGDEDGVLRRATNTVESADDNTLVFDFDFPDEALPLEGISGPGDSGGPALLPGNSPSVVGVSSRQDSGDYQVGHYGVREIYARVSAYADWIDQVMKADTDQRDAMAYDYRPCDGAPVPAYDASEYAGYFSLHSGHTLQFGVDDGALVRIDPDRELVHCGDDRFAYAHMDISMDFRRDADGRVMGITFNQWAPIPGDRTQAPEVQ